MSVTLYIGVAIAILSVIGLSVYTGIKRKISVRKVYSGKKEVKPLKGIGAGVVAGLIMGTFVGGSSTIGTAQLAYNYGLSSLWYTLGGGIGCLIMVLVYLKPFRSGSSTVVGMIDKEYGSVAGKAATMLNSLGTFISILAQLFSAAAVLLIFLPNFGTVKTVIISAAIMILYVIFGGTKGAGVVGLLKLILLYASMLLCGYLALSKIGGISAFSATLKGLSSETGKSFSSLFCRGIGTDSGALLSVILGIITTQTYAQAITSALSDRSAKIGGLLSAFIIPPIGVLGMLVGIYMRTVTNPATFNAKMALTAFITDYSGMPDILAGISLGILFISAVGTGAGIALGISLIIDDEFLRKNKSIRHIYPETRQRAVIFVIFALATLCACSPVSDSILSFSFLSHGLRGCTVFAPMTFLLIAKGRVDSRFALASIFGGSLTCLVLGSLNLFNVITLPCDAVFPGMAVGFVIMIAGLIFSPKKDKKIAADQ